MARAKAQKPNRNSNGVEQSYVPGGEQELQNNLLALLLVRGESQGNAVGTLAAAGMKYERIATLLGTTYGTVKQTIYKRKAEADGKGGGTRGKD